MVLNLEQIKEHLKNPKKKAIISKAIHHQNRLKFHSDGFLESGNISGPTNNFLEWVRTLIPKDKYNVFLNLFTFPLPTTTLTGSIYKELKRIFESKNSFEIFEFLNPEYESDWNEYLQNHLKGSAYWENFTWSLMKSQINAIAIVDLPEVQNSARPEPYFYFLDISEVIDYEVGAEDKFEWIIFKQKGNRIACFDDTFYRIFQLDEKGNLESLIKEENHSLGFCPARFFWTDPISSDIPDLKSSPISLQLSLLDWLLFFSISKKHLDLYAPYPIYSAYEADCDFRNNSTGDYCDGGFLRDGNGNFKILRTGGLEPCPICSNKKLVGVGSYIEIPIPTLDGPDLRNPVQITTVDKDSLQYNVDEVSRLKQEIFNACVGRGGETQQKQSLNELQVESNFESKLDVLRGIKSNFEKIQTFVYDTICFLRYGSAYLGCSISLGTEFYLYSPDELYERYKKAKENGLRNSVLNSLQDQIIDAEYKDDPKTLQRMEILKHLEPLRHYTLEESIKLKENGAVSELDFIIKINFNTFIDRFERENTNLLDFGSLLEFDDKIKIILTKLEDYGKEERNQGNPNS